ncbi:MAG: hypothetical protein HRT37_08360 [Alteromonadaceae bacterium]|nr:hypothetical protein [Alteromonadaceae bacterium]
MRRWDGDNRRKGKDILIIFTRILAIGGWLLFIVALIVSSYAAPETSYGYMRYRGIEVRTDWLTPIAGYLYIILWCSALSSYVCLLLNKIRGRRRDDSKHFNLILLMLVTIAWGIYLLVKLV